jgi:hypothetical protein
MLLRLAKKSEGSLRYLHDELVLLVEAEVEDVEVHRRAQVVNVRDEAEILTLQYGKSRFITTHHPGTYLDHIWVSLLCKL